MDGQDCHPRHACTLNVLTLYDQCLTVSHSMAALNLSQSSPGTLPACLLTSLSLTSAKMHKTPVGLRYHCITLPLHSITHLSRHNSAGVLTAR